MKVTKWQKPAVLAVLAVVLLAVIFLAARHYKSESPSTQTAVAPNEQRVDTQTVKGIITASPNPVKVCDGSGLGMTAISYTFPIGKSVEVHVGSPDGTLFARPGTPGTSTTAKWVTDGMVFFLQDVTGGKLPSEENTIARVTVRVTTEGCQ